MRYLPSASSTLLLAASTLATSTIHAQDPPNEDPVDTKVEPDSVTRRKEMADALVSRGLEELTAGRYTKAIEHLELADRLMHSPVILVALAEAYEKRGDLVKAAELLDEVASGGLGPNASPTFVAARNKARARLSKLDARIPKVRIVAKGARVRLDGKTLSSVELGEPVYVNPGTHIVVADTSACQAQQRTFEIAEGGNQTIELEKPDADAPSPTPVAATTSDLRRWHLGASLLFALSGASTIAAVGTGVAAISRYDDFNSQCPDDTCPAGVLDEVREAEALGTVAVVTLAGGAAAAITGALMWWAGSREEPDVMVGAGPGTIELMVRF